MSAHLMSATGALTPFQESFLPRRALILDRRGFIRPGYDNRTSRTSIREKAAKR
jgi:hypothetical protein